MHVIGAAIALCLNKRVAPCSVRMHGESKTRGGGGDMIRTMANHSERRVKSQRRGTAVAGAVVAGKGWTVALTHHNQNRNHAQRQQLSTKVGSQRRRLTPNQKQVTTTVLGGGGTSAAVAKWEYAQHMHMLGSTTAVLAVAAVGTV